MDNQNLYEDYEDYQENEESKLTTVALILGIASILLFPGGLAALAGLIVSIVCFVKKKNPKKRAVIALILSIVGPIWSMILAVIVSAILVLTGVFTVSKPRGNINTNSNTLVSNNNIVTNSAIVSSGDEDDEDGEADEEGAIIEFYYGNDNDADDSDDIGLTAGGISGNSNSSQANNNEIEVNGVKFVIPADLVFADNISGVNRYVKDDYTYAIPELVDNVILESMSSKEYLKYFQDIGLATIIVGVTSYNSEWDYAVLDFGNSGYLFEVLLFSKTDNTLIMMSASATNSSGGVPADCYNPLIDLIANIHIVN